VEGPGLYKTLKLDVPEGTQTGTVFRIPTEGVPRLNQHEKGDEYVIVRVLTPTNLSHKEKDLFREFEKLRQRSQDKTQIAHR